MRIGLIMVFDTVIEVVPDPAPEYRVALRPEMHIDHQLEELSKVPLTSQIQLLSFLPVRSEGRGSVIIYRCQALEQLRKVDVHRERV